MRRWCPDAEARADVPTAAGADPTLQRMVELAGLLGDSATLAERTTEYLCSGLFFFYFFRVNRTTELPLVRCVGRGEGRGLLRGRGAVSVIGFPQCGDASAETAAELQVGCILQRRRLPVFQEPGCPHPASTSSDESDASVPAQPPDADALKPTMADHERAERFSFALARSLDFTPECLQQLMYTQAGSAGRLALGHLLVVEYLLVGGWSCSSGSSAAAVADSPGWPFSPFPQCCLPQSTAERLRAAEELVMEGRAYLAARSTLKDAF